MKKERNLLIISDLHLNEGFDPETGKTSRLEDFLRDDAFARFLNYHEAVKEQPRFGDRPWLLVLNGDIFDFLQVVSLPRDGLPLQTVKCVKHRSNLTTNEQEYGLGTTAVETEWKLQQIAKGHQRFFAALGWFVARGNHVAVIRGNHDAELYWDQVQDRFIVETKRAHVRKSLREGTSSTLSLATCRERIRFYPRFFYEPERVYVEHGGQYEAANHFRDVMNPVLPDDPERIELPWGSLFVRYLFNQVEDVHPFADNIKPLTRYLSWAFRKDPIKTVEMLAGRGWVFLRAFWKAGRKATSSVVDTTDEKPPDEDAIRLSPEVREQIEALAQQRVKTAWRSRGKALLRGFISLLTWVIIGAIAVLAMASLARAREPWWRIAAYATAAILVYFLRRELMRSLSVLLEYDYLTEVAQELEQILASAGGVRVIVLGHDHQPTIKHLDKTWYVNTGAWVPIYEKEGPIEGREVLTFLRLAGDSDGAPELLRWDDAAGAPSRVILWQDEGLVNS